MSTATKTGLVGWLDAPASDVHRLDEHTVYTTCRCGARVEASAPDQIRAMLAGHWLFDDQHAAFVRAEEARRG